MISSLDFMASIFVHMQRLLNLLPSDMQSKTLFLMHHQYTTKRTKTQIDQKPNLVVFSPPASFGPPNATKINWIMNISIETVDGGFAAARIKDVLFGYWKPMLNFTIWETGGSTDFDDYVQCPGPVVGDFQETGGYTGNDGRSVWTLALHLRSPR